MSDYLLILGGLLLGIAVVTFNRAQHPRDWALIACCLLASLVCCASAKWLRL